MATGGDGYLIGGFPAEHAAFLRFFRDGDGVTSLSALQKRNSACIGDKGVVVEKGQAPTQARERPAGACLVRGQELPWKAETCPQAAFFSVGEADFAVV